MFVWLPVINPGRLEVCDSVCLFCSRVGCRPTSCDSGVPVYAFLSVVLAFWFEWGFLRLSGNSGKLSLLVFISSFPRGVFPRLLSSCATARFVVQ